MTAPVVATPAAPGAWRTAWRIARYRPGRYALSMALWIGVHVVPLSIGLVLRALFDRLGERPQPATASALALVAVLVAAESLRTAVLYEAIVVWIREWSMLSSWLRLNLLDAILSGPGATALRLPSGTGEAVSRFRDDVHDQIELIDTWLDVVGMALFGVAALWLMAGVDATVTLVVALPMVLVVAVVRACTGRIRTLRRAYRRTTGMVTDFIGELFGGVLAVKAAGAERAAVDRFDELNAERGRAATRDALLTQSLDSFNYSTVEVSIGLVLLLVAPAMRRAEFTVGELAMFTTYTAWLSGLPRMTGRLLARQRQAGVSGERLRRLLPETGRDDLLADRGLSLDGATPEPPAPEPTTAPIDRLEALELRGITARHPRSGRGVEAVTLRLERGSFTVITGRVGSGKTTLLRAVLGLMPLEAGEIRWNGETVPDPALFLVPPRSAYLPQVPRLFTESVRDNILLGCPGDGLTRAVGVAALEEDLEDMGAGLDTLVGPRGVRLSGGQVQRVAAARALVRAPELLVVDDLSSALDVETEHGVWAQLFAWRGETTALVVSHRPAVLARADAVITLEDGRIV